MKIGKNIIVVVPNDSIGFELVLPYRNEISYCLKKIYYGSIEGWGETKFIKCKYLKPNSGIRYKIIGKWWIFLLIKQLN